MSRIKAPALIQTLTDLKHDQAQLHTKQNFGGDSLVGSLTFTNNQYDLAVTLPATYNATVRKKMTFTPTNGKLAVANLYRFYSIDQPDVMTYYVPLWSNGPIVFMNIQAHDVNPATGVMTWYIQFINNDSTNAAHTAYFKYIFSGTDSGTVTFS